MLLKLKADLKNLSQIRDFVADTAADLGVAPGSLEDLSLAVDEAVTNIITHGYGGPGDIELELGVEASDLFVRIRDQAQSFDPSLARTTDLRPPGERDNPGGYGLFLMQSVMDEIAHRTIETGNELTMIKRDVVLNKIH